MGLACISGLPPDPGHGQSALAPPLPGRPVPVGHVRFFFIICYWTLVPFLVPCGKINTVLSTSAKLLIIVHYQPNVL